jgi:subtilisin family serine protease
LLIAVQNTDENGHGSHVAGTIGGNTFGVAKAVSLVAVKVLDADGAGTNSGVINGLNFGM